MIGRMKNKQAFEGFNPHLFPKLEKVAKAVSWLCHSHQLSEVSDHKFVHPLDDVFDRPPYNPEQYDTDIYRQTEQWGSVPDVSGKDI